MATMRSGWKIDIGKSDLFKIPYFFYELFALHFIKTNSHIFATSSIKCASQSSLFATAHQETYLNKMAATDQLLVGHAVQR